MTADTFAYLLDVLEQAVPVERADGGGYVLCSRCGQRAGTEYRATIEPTISLRVLCPMCVMVERPDPSTVLEPMEMIALILNRHGHMVHWRRTMDGSTYFEWSAVIERRS